MLEYLFHLWPWLLACLAVGAAAGWLTCRAPRGRVARWLVWAALAFGLGVIVAALGALRAEGGAMLESALAAFAFFLAGAAVASLIRNCSVDAYSWDLRDSWRALRDDLHPDAWRTRLGAWRAHEGWALGLIPAALLWLGAVAFSLPTFEAALQQRASAIVADAGEAAGAVTAAGRDLRAQGHVAENVSLLKALGSIPGVRKLLSAPEGAEAVVARIEAPRSAPAANPPRPGQEPRGILAAIPEGPLTLADCELALSATTAVEPVTFREKSAIVRRDAANALERVASFIRRCPDVPIEVIGRADAVGGEDDNSDLSLRRAAAAARYLRKEGVAGRRLIVVGYGAVKPPSQTEFASRPEDRTVQFGVKPTM